MKKTGILVVTIASVLVFTAGCAHLGGGGNDLESIQQTLTAWISASVAQDADKIMAVMSEDFSHDSYDYQAPDKAAMREYVEGSIAEGAHDYLEVLYEADVIKIEGDKAEVYPIDWTCSLGSATIGLTLKNEGGTWRIIDAVVEEM